MLDDEEKKQIENAFISAFDKWGQRYFEDLFSVLQSGTPDEKNTAYKTAMYEQLFLVKRSYEPGFFRHVLVKTMTNPIIKRQRLTLIEACINSILDAGIKIKDHTDEKNIQEQNLTTIKSEDHGYYTRREIQRLFHDYYPESFFVMNKNKYSDDRENIFSSVFSASDLPTMDTSNLVRRYLAEKKWQIVSNRDIMERLTHHSILRFALPEFLDDLISFRGECEKIFQRIGKNDERAKFLRDQIGDFSNILRLFHSHLTSILAMQWFRLRRKNGRMFLLKEDFPLKYGKQDSSKASRLLTKLTNSKDYASFMLQEAANALFYYRMTEGTVSLFAECKKLVSKTPLNQGILSENIAIAYRENKNYKLMLTHAKQAVEEYKKLGNVYRYCVGLKNMGEAQWMCGFKNAALKCFIKAEEHSKKLPDQNDRANVLINLATAFMRIGERKMEQSYLIKSLQTLPETETEKILGIDRRLSEIGRYC